MARQRDLIDKRNKNVKKRYDELSLKYPQWRHSAILEKIANEFYLTHRTIRAIFNDEGTYGSNEVNISAQLSLL